MANDHCDSPHGYTHFSARFENHPDYDTESVLNRLFDVVAEWCEKSKKSPDDPCVIEHFESSTGNKCGFPDEGEPMVTHHADGLCECYG